MARRHESDLVDDAEREAEAVNVFSEGLTAVAESYGWMAAPHGLLIVFTVPRPGFDAGDRPRVKAAVRRYANRQRFAIHISSGRNGFYVRILTNTRRST